MNRFQACRYLRCQIKDQFCLKLALAFNQAAEGFTIDKLHRVKIIFVPFSQVEYRGYVLMPDFRGGPRFP